MADPDIYSALVGGPPTAADQQALLIQALRRKNMMGQMAQISGDPVLNPMGAQMAKGADSQAEELGQQRIANQQLAQSGAFQKGELANREAVLKESMRQHDLEYKAKQMEYGMLNGGQDDALVDKIGNYDLAPPSLATRSPRAINLLQKVAEKYPEYDATNWKSKNTAITAFGSGPKGDQTRRFDVALSHLDTLDALVDAMNSGKVEKINQLKQAWQTQTGKPAPMNYRAASELAADEVSGAIVGQGKSAGALADRQAIQEKYNSALAPDILHSTNNVYRGMMMDQVRGLEQQYRAATGGLGDFRTRYLSPTGRALLEKADAAKASEKDTSPKKGWAIKLVNP